MKQAEAMTLAEKLEEFKSRFNRREYGNEFKLLGPWVESLAMISAMDTLAPENRPFAHMLYVANKGMTKSQSQEGPIGEGLEKIYKQLSRTVLAIAFDKPTPGAKELLRNAIPIMITAMLSGINIFNEFIIKPTENVEVNTFTFELILVMIINNNIVESVWENLLESCGATKPLVENGTTLLTYTSYLLAVIIAKTIAALDNEKLTHALKNNLLSLTKKLHIICEGRANDNDLSKALIFLQQTAITLESENFTSFHKAIEDNLSVLGITKAELYQDLKEIKKYNQKLLTLIEEQGETGVNEMTGFYQSG